jgi:hypothetical protein
MLLDLNYGMREAAKRPEPHRNHILASVPIESEVRTEHANTQTNFGFGTLVAAPCLHIKRVFTKKALPPDQEKAGSGTGPVLWTF